MADGYARVTGKPQAVLVHVDVGTQALAHGIHNASIGRAPVFIFAGLCPYTESGELTGSRTEYMHWLQEAHDQKEIVRQYCRYTGEIRTGLNVKQMVGRALQFASSSPQGPVYLTAARETLAEEIKPYSILQEQWVPVGPSALPDTAVETIAHALVSAKRPLIITGYSGRDQRCPEMLMDLADMVPGLRVLDTGGSDMSFPASHPASLGFRLASHDYTKEADMILLLDCDVPWIPSNNRPSEDTKIYHIDVDPLNQQIPVSFFPAHGRWKADSLTALVQIKEYLDRHSLNVPLLEDPKTLARKNEMKESHALRLQSVSELVRLSNNESLDGNNIGRLLKDCLPKDTVFVVEAVTCSYIMSDQLQRDIPGTWYNCGGTGIGWSNGAALGVKLALDAKQKELPGSEKGSEKPKLVCQVVGDGSFMCASPSSAAWVASKYKIPLLTVVLNNGGT